MMFKKRSLGLANRHTHTHTHTHTNLYLVICHTISEQPITLPTEQKHTDDE